MGILTRDTERLIEAKASQSGEAQDALVRRLLLACNAPRGRFDAATVRRIQQRVAALPALDERPLGALRDALWE